MFYGDFDNADDVYNCFNEDPRDHLGEVIVYASYDGDGYDGYAIVIFVKDGKFHIVTSSHCSCFGLEDQWEPEEMPYEALRYMSEEGTMYGNAERIRSVLSKLDGFGFANMPKEEQELLLVLRF